MARAEFRKELEKTHKVILVVYFAMLLTVLSLLWVSNMGVFTPGLVEGAGAASFRAVLWLIVFGEIVFLFWWKKRLVSKEAIFQGAQKMNLLPNIVRRSQTSEEKALGKAVTVYFFGNMIAFAVSESIALFGFFLASMGAFLLDHTVLTIMSLLFLMFFYPSQTFFANLIEAA